MPTKLTLRLDSALIDRAKTYAREQDRSLSQLVADYFAHLTMQPPTGGKAQTRGRPARAASGPITTGLRGALRQPADGATAATATKGRDDYRAHLEKKTL